MSNTSRAIPDQSSLDGADVVISSAADTSAEVDGHVVVGADSGADRARPRVIRPTVSHVINAGVVALFVLLAWQLRVAFFPIVPDDYIVWLKPWWDFIVANGGYRALGYEFSNYNMPYLYILTFLTSQSWDPLLAMKMASTVADFLMGLAVGGLVLHATGSRRRAAMAGLATLFVPTVVVNSAWLAQCDAMYVVFLILGLWAFSAGRAFWGASLFGIALAFKLQAVFFFPILLIRVLRREAPVSSLLWTGAVFVACDLPAWLAGRPFLDLMSIYVDQAGYFKQLNLSAPGVWAFVPATKGFEELYQGGLVLAVAATLALVYVAVTALGELTPSRFMRLALVVGIAVPFLLPSMHERYFFGADVLSVAVALIEPRKLWAVPLLVQFGSFSGYQAYLFSAGDLKLGAVAMLAALIITALSLRPESVSPRPVREWVPQRG